MLMINTSHGKSVGKYYMVIRVKYCIQALFCAKDPVCAGGGSLIVFCNIFVSEEDILILQLFESHLKIGISNLKSK